MKWIGCKVEALISILSSFWLQRVQKYTILKQNEANKEPGPYMTFGTGVLQTDMELEL